MSAVVAAISSWQTSTWADTSVARDLSLSEKDKLDLLMYFGKEGGNSEFGLVNGITRLAQDVENYDTRVDMERYAGRRLEQALVAK